MLIGGILIALVTVVTLATTNEKSEKLGDNDRYKVIRVDGRITFMKSGTDMKRGDFYLPGTLLDFRTRDSRAAVIHKDKGRYVLSGSSKGNVKVLPAANNISSRGGALLNVVDLKNYFDGRICILEETTFQIGSEAFPMTDSKFFYLKFEHNGEEINKRLSFKKDLLIFKRKEIFKVDGKEIDNQEKEMTLCYKDGNKTKKISTFTPIFPDMLDLKDEISLILQEFKKEPVGKKQDEVAAHLNEFYGKIGAMDVNTWLKDEFGI